MPGARAGGATDGSSSFLELGVPVSVQDLILGVVVQSGNDASIVLAERVGGTEATFAELMNATAARLGMTGSHFENATGLPSPQHYTTAQDMSLLAIALIRDFPQYYKWFSRARVRAQPHQAGKPQHSARQGSHRRRTEDRPHGRRGFLPRHLIAT